MQKSENIFGVITILLVAAIVLMFTSNAGHTNITKAEIKTMQIEQKSYEADIEDRVGEVISSADNASKDFDLIFQEAQTGIQKERVRVKEQEALTN